MMEITHKSGEERVLHCRFDSAASHIENLMAKVSFNIYKNKTKNTISKRCYSIPIMILINISNQEETATFTEVFINTLIEFRLRSHFTFEFVITKKSICFI